MFFNGVMEQAAAEDRSHNPASEGDEPDEVVYKPVTPGVSNNPAPEGEPPNAAVSTQTFNGKVAP